MFSEPGDFLNRDKEIDDAESKNSPPDKGIGYDPVEIGITVQEVVVFPDV